MYDSDHFVFVVFLPFMSVRKCPHAKLLVCTGVQLGLLSQLQVSINKLVWVIHNNTNSTNFSHFLSSLGWRSCCKFLPRCATHHCARAFFRRASVVPSSLHIWTTPALIQQMYAITDRYPTSHLCQKSLSDWSVISSSLTFSRMVFQTYSQPTDAVVRPRPLFSRSSLIYSQQLIVVKPHSSAY